jgi:hypothetical protein
MNRKLMDDGQYGIGLTVDAIIPLIRLHIAPPDQVVHNVAAIHYVRGDGSRIGDGVSTLQWVWDTMSRDRLSKLLRFLGDNEYAQVYIVSDRRQGLFPLPASEFMTFRATMWRPIMSGEDGVGVATSFYVFQTVRLTFVNLVELPGYL